MLVEYLVRNFISENLWSALEWTVGAGGAIMLVPPKQNSALSARESCFCGHGSSWSQQRKRNMKKFIRR